jgi:hypothetical protein
VVLRQYFISSPASIHLPFFSPSPVYLFNAPFHPTSIEEKDIQLHPSKKCPRICDRVVSSTTFFFFFYVFVLSISISRYTVCLYFIDYIVATCQRLCSDFVSSISVVTDTSIIADLVGFWAGIYHTWPHINYH